MPVRRGLPIRVSCCCLRRKANRLQELEEENKLLIQFVDGQPMDIKMLKHVLEETRRLALDRASTRVILVSEQLSSGCIQSSRFRSVELMWCSISTLVLLRRVVQDFNLLFVLSILQPHQAVEVALGGWRVSGARREHSVNCEDAASNGT